MGMWDNANWIQVGGGMRALKIATIVMGVLIVIGTVGLIIGIARRSSPPVVPVAMLPSFVAAVLDEPEGTRIAGIVAVRDRLAVQLQGGGVDRVVLIDPSAGTVVGRVSLARQDSGIRVLEVPGVPD
jgi:hypothetical protein